MDISKFVLLLSFLIIGSKEVCSLVGYIVEQSSAAYPFTRAHSPIDDDNTTCAVTKKRVGEYWRIQFNQSLTIAGVYLRLKGGNYTIEVQNASDTSSRQVCGYKHLPFEFAASNVNITCKPDLHGDVIIVKKTNNGSLSLCDFKLKVCEFNNLDILCTKCTPSSSCKSCDGSHYGVWCERPCSPGCVPGTCDELIGECSRCKDGYHGNKCQISKNCTCRNCFSACIECHTLTEECTRCQKSRYGKLCQYECHPNCDTCDINNGTCLSCKIGYSGENCSDQRPVGMDVEKILFWVLFPIGFIIVLATPFLLKTFCRRLRCSKTISFFNHTMTPTMTLSEQAMIARNTLNSSRVILEPEGTSHYLDDPYDGVVQVVVTFSNIKTKSLSIEQFVKDTHQKMMANEFRSEFKILPNGLMNLHTEALKMENSTKNRFKKIYPYDANRVILEPLGNLYSGNYINASYINGVYRENAYIAAQGPFTPQTVADFWRMVWQTQSKRIVMLTRLTEGNVEKCMQYWPGDAGEFGPFSIIVQKEDILDKFAVRKFIVRRGEETRRVTQYQFMVWPDTKVPLNLEALLCFRNISKNSISPNEGPIIVHGSAGIGRTGTFIALDYLLEKGFKEGSVDVKNCVINLRQQRAFSIQSVDQYIFLHDALVEGLTNLTLNCALHVVDEM
ncbi:receptor-type tyrosine-protein phosphatase epsilon-like [Saccostrea echinata]|uniref:receptor-type tyrosine-protein phosphatase epsilon-like n=1 Tax=Saccostrea echinata TaxID=191078 RepID=UPI002A81B7BA|nr:receptor-type tyrosine-protein phosphatase epsilon-like [Saccostrea echinata]